MIPFNLPTKIGTEKNYLEKSLSSNHISGDGIYTKKCEKWFEKNLECKKALLTSSCTHALEMCALLLNIQKNDEIIMPSYTFVSTANAFALRGAKVVFVDIRPETMNIDESKIEKAITKKTKAIVVVHYAGVACEMDKIMNIANKHNIFVIEDAAQALMSKYKNKYLGTIGHLGTFSFHETKNITSAGEGGALIINDKNFINKAEIIREKGTNRSAFFRGEIDKYSWVDLGSSYLMNDLSASFLYAQLKKTEMITKKRLKNWDYYYKHLEPLKKSFIIPSKLVNSMHNGHIFYIKVKNVEERKKLLTFLKKNQINAIFHYIPLHTSNAGINFSIFFGEDKYTTSESERIVRLPLFYSISKSQQKKVIKKIKEFYDS